MCRAGGDTGDDSLGELERMQAEQPDLASAVYEFIIGVLAERIESSNRVVVTLMP